MICCRFSLVIAFVRTSVTMDLIPSVVSYSQLSLMATPGFSQEILGSDCGLWDMALSKLELMEPTPERSYWRQDSYFSSSSALYN